MTTPAARHRKDLQSALPALSVWCVLSFIGFLFWLAFWPPSKETATLVSGVVVRHEAMTRPNGKITDNDTITVSTRHGSREIYLERALGTAGTVISGKQIMARVNRNNWIMALDVEGRESIAFEPSAAVARRRFWATATIGTALLSIFALFALARLHERR
jgi:hypothetical protein